MADHSTTTAAQDADTWRTPGFRQKIITQIEEAMCLTEKTLNKSGLEMENHIFQKAKTREEYLALVARLIIHVKEISAAMQPRAKKSKSELGQPEKELCQSNSKPAKASSSKRKHDDSTSYDDLSDSDESLPLDVLERRAMVAHVKREKMTTKMMNLKCQLLMRQLEN